MHTALPSHPASWLTHGAALDDIKGRPRRHRQEAGAHRGGEVAVHVVAHAKAGLQYTLDVVVRRELSSIDHAVARNIWCAPRPQRPQPLVPHNHPVRPQGCTWRGQAAGAQGRQGQQARGGSGARSSCGWGGQQLLLHSDAPQKRSLIGLQRSRVLLSPHGSRPFAPVGYLGGVPAGSLPCACMRTLSTAGRQAGRVAGTAQAAETHALWMECYTAHTADGLGALPTTFKRADRAVGRRTVCGVADQDCQRARGQGCRNLCWEGGAPSLLPHQPAVEVADGVVCRQVAKQHGQASRQAGGQAGGRAGRQAAENQRRSQQRGYSVLLRVLLLPSQLLQTTREISQMGCGPPHTLLTCGYAHPPQQDLPVGSGHYAFV